jgi:hypothetical protein
LLAGKTFEVFAMTNRHGGVLSAGLEFRPVQPTEVRSDAEAIVRLSSATNVRHLVLGYFTSTIPAGHVLQAAASQSGLELEVHTSISKSATFDNGTLRWDFPESFTTNEMQAAVAQIIAHKDQPFPVPPGGRSTVFSVTNKAGSVYNGLFELLTPAGTLRELKQSENAHAR